MCTGGRKSSWLVAVAAMLIAGYVESRAAEQQGGSGKEAAAAQGEPTCGGSWQKVNVKTSKFFLVSETEVPVALTPAKAGQRSLKWANPDGKDIEVDFHRTKAAVSPEGEIEICSQAVVLYRSGDSYALPHSGPELQKLNLQPGSYAIRVRVGCQSPGCSYAFSNFIVTQLPSGQ